MRFALVAAACLLACASGLSAQVTVPVTFAWDLDTTHENATWEAEIDGAIVPCGSVQVTATDRRCTVPSVPAGTHAFRLRGTVADENGDPLVGEWSLPLADTVAPPGPFTIHVLFEPSRPEPEPEPDPMALSVAQFAQSANMFSGSTSNTVTGLSWSSGDIIVVIGGLENNAGGAMGTPTNANLTFTLRASQTSGGVGEPGIWIWTAAAGSAQSNQTITASKPSRAGGLMAWVITGGPTGVANATANVLESPISITPTAGSVVIYGFADWNANQTNQTIATGSGTATERADGGDGATWGFFGGDWVGVTAASTAFGVSSYTGLAVAQGLIEILAPDEGGGGGTILPQVMAHYYN